jgi:release factor glutamine methyltransferase
MSLGSALERAVAELRHTSPSPRLDAEVLLMKVCGLGHAELVTRADRALSDEQTRDLEALVARRCGGEPVAYLTGTREFWSMELDVSPATLIPRPETELLIELALECIPVNARWTVFDIGTGCGAIALTLAKERPHCRIIASDCCVDALQIADSNAKKHGLSRGEFRAGRWFAPLAGEHADLIVSNPPYVRHGDPHLRSPDLRFEPVQALLGGRDGLDGIRHLIHNACQHLRVDGWLLLEHGYEQAGAVTRLMRRYGYRRISMHRDHAQRDRAIRARRPRSATAIQAM